MRCAYMNNGILSCFRSLLKSLYRNDRDKNLKIEWYNFYLKIHNKKRNHVWKCDANLVIFTMMISFNLLSYLRGLVSSSWVLKTSPWTLNFPCQTVSVWTQLWFQTSSIQCHFRWSISLLIQRAFAKLPVLRWILFNCSWPVTPSKHLLSTYLITNTCR